VDASLNPKLATVIPSPTAALMERARQLKGAGGDVVNLAGGEPDMAPAELAREAGVDRLRRGDLSYGPISGLIELRRGIAEQISRRHGIKCAPSEILVGVGTKQVLFEALFAATAPGDEIIIPSPYWVSYPAMALLVGGAPKIVSTAADTGFKLVPKQLSDALTSRTRWLILNSPSNPTGAVYRRDELGALAEIIRDHPRLLVLSDDIYEDIYYGENKPTTIAALGPDLADRSVICSGFSKGHAMTGLRVGYARAPSWLIEPMTKLQSHMTAGGCVVGQHAAAQALVAARDFPSDCRTIYSRRRALGLHILAGSNRLTVTPPAGAFYFWIGIEDLLNTASPTGRQLMSDSDISEALLSDNGLALVPGSAFGTRGYLRMSFAASDEIVSEGCRRLTQFAQTCSKSSGSNPTFGTAPRALSL
jgi:aspartate aminotransferase